MTETHEKEMAKSDPRPPPECQGIGLVGQGIASNHGSRSEQIYALVVGYIHICNANTSMEHEQEYGVHKLYIPKTRNTMLVRIEPGMYRLVNIHSLPAWSGRSIIHGQRIYIINLKDEYEYREAYIVNYEESWKWTVYDPQDDTLTVYDLGRMRKNWEFLDIGVWNINGKALSTWSTPPNA